MMINVCVLISTFNGEEYIQDQLESIINQQFTDDIKLSILVRDDGSSDNTKEILKKYEKIGNLTWYAGENVKPGRSFWDLVNNCEAADYYAFCDQDDVWFQDKIQRAVNKIKNINDIPALYASNFTSTNSKLVPIDRKKSPLNNYTDFFHSLIYSTAPGCTFVFNDKARMELKKYQMDSTNAFLHDWLAQKIILISGVMFYDSTPSMYYRQHGNNVVGVQQTGIVNFISRAVKNVTKYNTTRSNCAIQLYRFYRDELTEDKEKIVLSLINYKTDKESYTYLKNLENIKTHTIYDLSLKILLFFKRV